MNNTIELHEDPEDDTKTVAVFRTYGPVDYYTDCDGDSAVSEWGYTRYVQDVTPELAAFITQQEESGLPIEVIRYDI